MNGASSVKKNRPVLAAETRLDVCTDEIKHTIAYNLIAYDSGCVHTYKLLEGDTIHSIASLSWIFTNMRLSI